LPLAAVLVGTQAAGRGALPYFRFAQGDAEVLDDVVVATAWDETQKRSPPSVSPTSA